MPPTVSTSNRKKSKETSRENALRDNQASRIPTRALAVRRFVNGPSALIAAVVWVSGALVAIALHEELHRSGLVPLALLVSVLVGSFLLFSIKVVDQWEKAVVLRLREVPRAAGARVSSGSSRWWTSSRTWSTSACAPRTSPRSRRSLGTPCRSTSTPSCSGWCGTRRRRCWRCSRTSTRSSCRRRPRCGRRSDGTTSPR